MESLDIGHDAAERRLRAIEALDADFHGLLQLKGLSEVLQAKLAVARVRTIARFAAMADSRSAMRQFGNEVLALDPLRDLVEVAALVDAWESATLRVAVRNQAVSEAKVSALPRAVPKVETSNLKEKFEAVHNIKLEDRATPAPSTLEQMFEQIEQGELKNMSIVQFVSREDAEAEILGATIDKSTGNLKVKKGYGECAKPTTPEEFRARANVMANTYLMAQIKYPQKALLKGLRRRDFQEYVNYLMGDSVLGLQARDQHGQVVSAPSFELALSYDFQLRRLAVRLANEGATFAQALRQARDDLPTKERYFLTPNACAPVACATNAASRSRSPPQRTPGMMSPQRASRSAGAGTILVSGAVTTAVELMYVSSVLGLIHAMPATAPVRALQADEFQDYRAPLTSLGESLHTSAPRRGAANSTWWTPFSGQLKWGKGFFAREGGEALH